MTLLHAFQSIDTARILLRIPYIRVLYDVYGASPGLWMQWKAMSYPWHLVVRIAALNFLGIIGYAWGSNVDHGAPDRDGNVVIQGSRARYVFRKDRDEVEKEKRMGVLGRPAPQESNLQEHAYGNPGQVNIAVVCPVLIGGREDIEALQRVHQSLISQTRKADLILFIDDGSLIPLQLQDGSDDKRSTTHILRLAKNRGPAAARNAGIDCAITALGNRPDRTIVLLLDVDCAAPPKWIQHGYDAVLANRPDLLDPSHPVEPLIISGMTSGTNRDSFYTLYNDHFGTLNPRIIRRHPGSGQSDAKPLYGPTCNMVVLPGSLDARTTLPRFHEGFREAAQEDVVFCLDAVYGRGCEFIMNKRVEMKHEHREGVLATWQTMRKYGRWYPAVMILHPEYVHLLWNASESVSSVVSRKG